MAFNPKEAIEQYPGVAVPVACTIGNARFISLNDLQSDPILANHPWRQSYSWAQQSGPPPPEASPAAQTLRQRETLLDTLTVTPAGTLSRDIICKASRIKNKNDNAIVAPQYPSCQINRF